MTGQAPKTLPRFPIEKYLGGSPDWPTTGLDQMEAHDRFFIEKLGGGEQAQQKWLDYQKRLSANLRSGIGPDKWHDDFRKMDDAYHKAMDEFVQKELDPGWGKAASDIVGSSFTGATQAVANLGYGAANLLGMSEAPPPDMDAHVKATARYVEDVVKGVEPNYSKSYRDVLDERERIFRKIGVPGQVARFAFEMTGSMAPTIGFAVPKIAGAITATAQKIAPIANTAARVQKLAQQGDRWARIARFVGEATPRAVGFGALSGIEGYYNRETGEWSDGWERATHALTEAALWYGFEMISAGGNLVAESMDKGARSAAFVEWLRGKPGVRPMPNESPGQFMQRAQATWELAGNPGVGKGAILREIEKAALVGGAEGAAFSALDVEWRKNVLSALIDGDEDAFEKALVQWLGTSFAIGGLRAGGSRNWPWAQRANAPRGAPQFEFREMGLKGGKGKDMGEPPPEGGPQEPRGGPPKKPAPEGALDFQRDTRGRTVPSRALQVPQLEDAIHMGWRPTGEARLERPGPENYWIGVREDGGIELSDAMRTHIREMELPEDLRGLEIATLSDLVESRRFLPGITVDVDGTTAVESRRPLEVPSTLYVLRNGTIYRKPNATEQSWERADDLPVPEADAPPEQQQVATAIAERLLALPMPREVQPLMGRTYALLRDVSREHDFGVDTALRLAEGGVLDAALAAARTPEMAEALVKEYARTAAGLQSPEIAVERLGGLTNAQQDPEAAQVHGDVLDQQGAQEGQGEVPAKEGGPGVPEGGQEEAENSLDTFLGQFDPMKRGRLKKSLEMQVSHTGPKGREFVTRAELIESAVREGASVRTDILKSGEELLAWPDERFLNQKDITKGGLEYAKYLAGRQAKPPTEGPEAGAVYFPADKVVEAIDRVVQEVAQKAGSWAVSDSYKRLGYAGEVGKEAKSKLQRVISGAKSRVGRIDAKAAHKARVFAAKNFRTAQRMAREIQWKGEGEYEGMKIRWGDSLTIAAGEGMVDISEVESLSPEMRKTAQQIMEDLFAVRDASAAELEDANVQIELSNGKKVPFRHKPEQKRLPRLYAPDGFDGWRNPSSKVGSALRWVASKENDIPLDRMMSGEDPNFPTGEPEGTVRPGESEKKGLHRESREFARKLQYVPSVLEVDGRIYHIIHGEPQALIDAMQYRAAGRAAFTAEFPSGSSVEMSQKIRESAGRTWQKLFDHAVLRIHGQHFQDPLFYPGDFLYRPIRVLRALDDTVAMIQLSGAWLVNIPETIGSTWPELGGWKVGLAAYQQAAKGLMNSVRASAGKPYKGDTLADMRDRYAALGWTTRELPKLTTSPGREFEDIVRMLGAGASSLTKIANEFNDVIAAAHAEAFIANAMRGKINAADRAAIRSWDIFDAEELASIFAHIESRGAVKAPWELWNRIGLEASSITQNTGSPAQQPHWKQDRFLGPNFKFVSYAIRRAERFSKHTKDVWDGFETGRKTGKWKEFGQALAAWLRFMGYETLSGTVAQFLAAAARGGFSGDLLDEIEAEFKRMMADPFWYFLKNNLITLFGGPVTAFAEGLLNPDDTYSLRNLMGVFRPLMWIAEAAVVLFGSKWDPGADVKSFGQRFADSKFNPVEVFTSAPLTRQMKDLFTDQSFKNAYRRYYQWRDENMGEMDDDRATWLNSLRTAAQMLREGEEPGSERVMELINEALGVPGKTREDVRAYLLNRRLLEGRSMTEIEKAGKSKEFFDQLTADDVEALQRYDAALTRLAERVAPKMIR